MDEPLYVVRHTGIRWLTTANHELFVFDTKLASARGLTLKTGRERARVDRAVYGKVGFSGARERTQAWADERIARVLEMSDEELLAQAPDNMIIGLDTIAAARLSKRFGFCKLRVTLDTGRKIRWRWLNQAENGMYRDIGAALHRVLGSRLTMSGST
jgi:hypothetical protein